MMNRLKARVAASFSRDDAARLLASFVLATMLWGWVSLVTDPEVTRSFVNVPVAYEPLDGDEGELRMVTPPPAVTVRLTGPESAIDDVLPSEVTASIDTSVIDGPGRFTLEVHVEASDGVRRRRVIPSQVTVQVERTRTETLELVPEVEELPEADPRQIGQVQPTQPFVTVTGSESDVARIDRVVLPIAVGAHSRDFEEEFVPIAVDASGAPVTAVEISPERIQAMVPVSRRGRSVAVLASVQGVPAEGYEVVDRRINPPTVQIDGPADVLSSSITILTEPIDVTGTTQTLTQRVRLDPGSLPQGVVVIDPPDGVVEVIVQIAQRGVEQTLPDQAVTPVGLAPGLAVTLDPGSVDVTVVATQAQLQALQAGDIVVTVDLTGLEPGAHELPLSVSVPPNMRWVRVEPARITATIAAAPATPEAGAAASPAATAGASGRAPGADARLGR